MPSAANLGNLIKDCVLVVSCQGSRLTRDCSHSFVDLFNYDFFYGVRQVPMIIGSHGQHGFGEVDPQEYI